MFPKLSVLAVCAVSATPLFAAGPAEQSPIKLGLYSLHDAHDISRPSGTRAENPLTLAAFLQWSAVSFPTAENVIVMPDRLIKIGARIYND